MNVLGVVALLPAVPLVLHVETALEDPESCEGFGARARLKDRDRVVLIDLPCFGRRSRLLWVQAPLALPECLVRDGELDRDRPSTARRGSG